MRSGILFSILTFGCLGILTSLCLSQTIEFEKAAEGEGAWPLPAKPHKMIEPPGLTAIDFAFEHPENQPLQSGIEFIKDPALQSRLIHFNGKEITPALLDEIRNTVLFHYQSEGIPVQEIRFPQFESSGNTTNAPQWIELLKMVIVEASLDQKQSPPPFPDPDSTQQETIADAIPIEPIPNEEEGIKIEIIRNNTNSPEPVGGRLLAQNASVVIPAQLDISNEIRTPSQAYAAQTPPPEPTDPYSGIPTIRNALPVRATPPSSTLGETQPYGLEQIRFLITHPNGQKSTQGHQFLQQSNFAAQLGSYTGRAITPSLLNELRQRVALHFRRAGKTIQDIQFPDYNTGIPGGLQWKSELNMLIITQD